MKIQAKHFGPSLLLQRTLIKTFHGSMIVNQSFCLIVMHLNDGSTLLLKLGLQNLHKWSSLTATLPLHCHGKSTLLDTNLYTSNLLSVIRFPKRLAKLERSLPALLSLSLIGKMAFRQ